MIIRISECHHDISHYSKANSWTGRFVFSWYSANHFWQRFRLAGFFFGRFSADKNSAANPVIGYDWGVYSGVGTCRHLWMPQSSRQQPQALSHAYGNSRGSQFFGTGQPAGYPLYIRRICGAANNSHFTLGAMLSIPLSGSPERWRWLLITRAPCSVTDLFFNATGR